MHMRVNLPLISSVLLGLKSVLYQPAEAYSAPSQTSQMERLQTYLFNKNFCSSDNLTSMVNKATCYKNPYKPIYVDLIWKNCPGSFQNSCVVEAGLSDFHKIVVTVMKTSYWKRQHKIIHCRNYENFSNDIFRDSLQKIFQQNLGNSCGQDVHDFIISCNKILDQYAPRKSKYVKGNHSPFMNKNLCKAIMLRAKLRNIFL